MSSNALELIGSQQLQRVEITNEQLQLAKNTVAAGLNPAEFELYLYDCKRQGVHPLDRLLIPVVTKDDQGNRRLAMWTTIDLLRSRAAESGEYAGSDDPAFGYIEPAKNPMTATVSVYRLVQGHRCVFTATARWEEYFPGEKRGFKWKQSPHIMLGKCAEALALRKAFPKQLASLYAQEELERAESYDPEVTQGTQERGAAPEPIKQTTVKPPAAQQGSQPPTTTAAPAPTQQAPTAPTGEPITEKQRKMFFAIQKSAGVDEDKVKAWLAERGIAHRNEVPKSMFQELIDWIDPEFKFHTQQRPKQQDDF